jgi:short-subunit dehydrogenase
LDALAGEVRRLAGDAVVLPADLSRPAEVFRVVEGAEEALGRLDLVVANAGVGKCAYLVNFSWEDIEQMLMVNTIGAMALIRAALPGMIRRGSGYIAGISSLSSYRGAPTGAPYCSSKAALSTFLEGVRVEVRGKGVAVINIHPGYVHTPMASMAKGPMPFAMDADRAARLILRAIVRKKPVYDFPWQMGLVARFVRLLPAAIYDRMPRSGFMWKVLAALSRKS